MIQGLLKVSLFCFGFIYFILSFAFFHSFLGLQDNCAAFSSSVPLPAQKLNPLFADNEFQWDHCDSPELLENLTSWTSLYLALILSLPFERRFRLIHFHQIYGGTALTRFPFLSCFFPPEVGRIAPQGATLHKEMDLFH